MNDRSASPRWLGARERPYDLRAQPMVSLAAAAAVGILADRGLHLPMATWVGAWAGVFTVIVALFWLSWRRTSLHRSVHGPDSRYPVEMGSTRWALVMLCVALSMAIRSRTDQQAFESATICPLVDEQDKPVLIRGIVRGEIQKRPSLQADRERIGTLTIGANNAAGGDSTTWQTLFVVDVLMVRVGREWQPFTGGIRVTADGDYSEIGPGDRVEMGGKLSAFLGPTNPGESDFRRTARNHWLHARLMVDDGYPVKILERGGPSFRRFADALAKSGERTLQSTLGSDLQAIACALVVGRRASLDSALKDSLLETGTIHLLSVSGLHLGIVAGVLMSISVLAKLPRTGQVAFVAFGCTLFAAVTGGNPPVLRATILVATILLSLLVNRRQWPLNTLAMAAIILWFLNPTDLTQVGVQLSFVSVATLVCSSRSMDPAIRVIAESKDAESRLEGLVDATRSAHYRQLLRFGNWVRGAFWLSTCVSLVTTPLVWLNFNVVSPVSVLANVLLGIPTALALISGLVAVVLGWVTPGLASLPAYACDWILNVLRWLIDLSDAIPFGHFWLPSPPAWWVAVFYVILFGSFAIRARFNRARAFVLGSLIWCLVAWLLAISPSYLQRDSLQATFIDVGHGTSVLIEMPSGENHLYDCGSLGNHDFSSHGMEDVIWSRGITRLDSVMLSHADSDHYNALPGLIRRFRIDQVITPPGLFASPVEALKQIRSTLERNGIPVRELSRDDQWADEKQSIALFHPPMIRLRGNDNVNSLVVRIDFGGRSLILPGDIEPPGTDLLIQQPRPIAGGVLMAPHHGSRSANSESILDWSRPSEVIVSGGERAKRPEVIELLQVRGSNVMVTAIHGAIRVNIRGVSIETRRFRTEPW